MSLPNDLNRQLLPVVLADFYVRLHQKSITATMLFDSSWPCATTRPIDTFQWSRKMLTRSKSIAGENPLFTNFLDRLILLSPQNCQVVLSTAVLLSRREAFRHCIDGSKVRALQVTLGVSNIASVLKSTSVQPIPLTTSDWQTSSLLAEAFCHVRKVCEGPRQLVVEYLTVALPKQLPAVESNYDEAHFDNLLREVCTWRPELKWLFG